MTRSAKKPRLWFAILTLLAFVGWAPTDFVKHGTTHCREAVRLAAAGETWWCQRGGVSGKLKGCFEENMQTDGVPLLKDYDTYQASLPVRELRTASVDYITAASHSGKSASVVVGFLRSRELDSGDDARLNFTHYLYMQFANNGGNDHENIDEAGLESKCGKNTKLRAALGAAYMRDCFRAQAFGRRFHRLRPLRRFLRLPCEETTYLRAWKPGAFLIFKRTKRHAWEGRLHLHAMQSKGCGFGARAWAQVYVSRPRLPERCHESTCRASWCPGLGKLHWHSTPAQAEVFRNLPTTHRMFASRWGDNAWRSAYPWTTST